ncbi:hypothetical protein EV697_101388 [Bisgaardia hudsonensis]|uniref:Uncharacterized protein n=1 Tax=Bisgaardia hudsonensis TaxID=109472 RepID=A0A4R2N347_9PAST|nr:hypothetical protein [Bisgaardia hudsonensis]QLB12701.1 hypothetical protein A6A11_03315 [Bisgaardia hudsonensis]TCP14249.1 hypothetical protein EV697_101388 [Bisgaardia hudsonensis]
MLIFILKKLIILFLPSIFWIILTALGFGAQSLANLIELFVLLVLSLICVFIPENIIEFKYLLALLLIIAFVSRLLMPIIPE